MYLFIHRNIYLFSFFFPASLSLKASGNVIILYHWCAGAGCLTTSTVLQNFLLLLLFLRLRLIFIYLFLKFFLIILCNKITLGSWISCTIHTTLCPFRWRQQCWSYCCAKYLFFFFFFFSFFLFPFPVYYTIFFFARTLSLFSLILFKFFLKKSASINSSKKKKEKRKNKKEKHSHSIRPFVRLCLYVFLECQGYIVYYESCAWAPSFRALSLSLRWFKTGLMSRW